MPQPCLLQHAHCPIPGPKITIEVNLLPDDKGGPQITFMDNGRGMDLSTLHNYFRMSWTTSGVPPLPRGAWEAELLDVG